MYWLAECRPSPLEKRLKRGLATAFAVDDWAVTTWTEAFSKCPLGQQVDSSGECSNRLSWCPNTRRQGSRLSDAFVDSAFTTLRVVFRVCHGRGLPPTHSFSLSDFLLTRKTNLQIEETERRSSIHSFTLQMATTARVEPI